MAVTSCGEFYDLLAKSGLIAPGDLAVKQLVEAAADPREAAKRLIAEGRITKWQAQQLLAGRSQLFLGKYKLLDKLGEGGMGAVYKAEQTGMGRLVAVKVMSQDVLKDEGAAGRFHREIRSVSALNHPNIIAAIDANQVGQSHFLVMEYVEGRDLKAWITEHPRLPVDWACECIRQAALGLQHAHEKGLVHRDIKPGNLLVVGAEGELPHVKILDMGLARFTSEAQCTQITKTGQVLGTIDYISPEQARDTKGADIRADVFSLGCTLYRMLAGEVPYTGRNPVEKLMARAMKDAPLIRSVAPEVPAALERVIATMLARKPEDRYQTPQEVADALAPFAAATAGKSDASSQLNLPPIEGPSATGSTVQADADATLNKFLELPQNDDMDLGVREPAIDAASSSGAALRTTYAADGAPNRMLLIGGGIAALVAVVAAAFVLSRGGGDPALVKGKGPGEKGKREPGKTPPANTPPANAPPAGRDFALEFVRSAMSRANMPSLKVGPSQVLTLEARILPRDQYGQNTSLFTINSVNIRNEHGRWVALYWRASEGVEVITGPPVELGRMVHVAVVCDQAHMRLFIDGALSGTTDLRAIPPTTSTPDFAIGWDFAGVVDEVRVSKVARYAESFRPPARFESDADTLALYHFDEGQGDQVKDASGNGHHGKLTPAIRWVKTPAWSPPAAIKPPDNVPPVAPARKGDHALEFAEGGAYVDVPSLRYEGDHPITVELWATREEPPKQIGMALMVSGVQIKSFGRNWQFAGLAANGERDSIPHAKDPSGTKRQVHLAFVFNGQDCRAFVDGQSRGATPCKKIVNRWGVATVLGRARPDNDDWAVFKGRIDEVRISKVARYAKDFIPPRPGERHGADADTLALWHCDEGQGDVLKDSSGNGHDGKIVGARWVRGGALDAGPAVVESVPTEGAAGPITAVKLEVAGTLAGNATDLVTVAWSRDGKVAATGGKIGRITYWDVEKPQMSTTFAAPGGGEIRRLAFSPDGKKLYSVASPGVVTEWTDAAKVPSAEYLGQGMALAADGGTLATVDSATGAIYVWDTAKRGRRSSLTGGGPLALSADGKRLAAFTGSTLLVRPLGAGAASAEAKSELKLPQDVAFSPDGRSLAVAWQESGVEIWSVEPLALRASYVKGPRGGAGWVEWSPDSRLVAAGGVQDSTLYVLDASNAAPLGSLNLMAGGLTRGVFSQDGKRLLVASNQREVKLVSVKVESGS